MFLLAPSDTGSQNLKQTDYRSKCSGLRLALDSRRSSLVLLLPLLLLLLLREGLGELHGVGDPERDLVERSWDPSPLPSPSLLELVMSGGPIKLIPLSSCSSWYLLGLYCTNMVMESPH